MHGNTDADAFCDRNAIVEYKNSRINPTLSDPGFYYSQTAWEKETANCTTCRLIRKKLNLLKHQFLKRSRIGTSMALLILYKVLTVGFD